MKNKTTDIVQSIADRLTLALEHDILFDDVAHALFMLWEYEADLEQVNDVFELDFDFDSTYHVLKHFSFESFQQVIYIDAAYYEDVLLHEYNKPAGQRWSLKWRITSYDPREILSTPHLFQADNNLRLDMRSGACMRKDRFVEKIPLEKLVFIRKWVAAKLPKELPAVYIN